jgi:hypothetical protein
MGYPYHQLIPAAIMDLNPGCTKEELVALFSAVPYVEREYPAHNLENLRFMSHMHEKVSVYDTGDWLNPIIIREKKSQNQFKQMIRQSNLVRWDLSNRPIEETTSSLATGLYGLAYLLGLSGRTPESLYAKDAFGLTLGPSHFECHAVYNDMR